MLSPDLPSGPSHRETGDRTEEQDNTDTAVDDNYNITETQTGKKAGSITADFAPTENSPVGNSSDQFDEEVIQCCEGASRETGTIASEPVSLLSGISQDVDVALTVDKKTEIENDISNTKKVAELLVEEILHHICVGKQDTNAEKPSDNEKKDTTECTANSQTDRNSPYLTLHIRDRCDSVVLESIPISCSVPLGPTVIQDYAVQSKEKQVKEKPIEVGVSEISNERSSGVDFPDQTKPDQVPDVGTGSLTEDELDREVAKMTSVEGLSDPLGSSINRSRAYEKLLRKQLAGEEGWRNDQEPEMERSELDKLRSALRKTDDDTMNRCVDTSYDRTVEPSTRGRHNYEHHESMESRPETKDYDHQARYRDRNIRKSRDDRDSERNHVERGRETERDYRSHDSTNIGQENGDFAFYPTRSRNSSSPERRRYTDEKTSYRDSNRSPERGSHSSSRDYLSSNHRSRTDESPQRTAGDSAREKRQSSPSRTLCYSDNKAYSAKQETEAGHKTKEETEERKRIRDLQETEAALKKLLRERGEEIDSLRTKNRILQDELESRPRGAEDTDRSILLQRQIDDLIRDKENLTTEVFQLQHHLEGIYQKYPEERSQKEIENYKPNNPIALQRKIEELQSQVQDLQEASETSGSHLARAEEELAQLKEENENLKISQEINLGDLQRENTRLRDQLNKMMESPERTLSGEETFLRQEISQLRHELRSLRERNHQLNENNIQLIERLRDAGAGGTAHKTLERSTTTDKFGTYSLSREDRERYRDIFRGDTLTHSREINSLVTPPRHSYREDIRMKDEVLSQRSYDQRSDVSDSRRSVGHVRDDLAESRGYVYGRTDHLATSRSLGSHSTDRGYRSMSSGRTTELLNGDRSPGYSPTSGSLRSTSQSPSRTRLNRIDVEDYPRSNAYRRSSEKFREEHTHFRDTLQTTKSPSATYAPNGYSTLPPDFKYRSKTLSREITQPNDKQERYTYEKQSSMPRDYLRDTHRERDISFAQDVRDGPRRDIQEYERNGHVDWGREVNMLTRPRERSPERRREHERPAPTDRVSDISENRLRVAELHKARQHQDVTRELEFETDDDLTELPLPLRKVRSDSVGSGNTDLILTEADDALRHGAEDRPKSPQMDEINDQLGLQPTPPGTPPPLPPHGQRSVLPQPTVTQSNKHLLGPQRHDEGWTTSGLRPFAPRAAADINVNDIVKFCRDGGMICRGQVKYVGHLPGKNDVFLGLELEREDGKHDGEYEGQRYYNCKPNRGLFISFDKVVMAWNNQ